MPRQRGITAQQPSPPPTCGNRPFPLFPRPNATEVLSASLGMRKGRPPHPSPAKAGRGSKTLTIEDWTNVRSCGHLHARGPILPEAVAQDRAAIALEKLRD